MPFYEYTGAGGRKLLRRSTIAGLPALDRRMAARGFRRRTFQEIYAVRNHPTYTEALEETQHLLDLADRGQGPLVGGKER